MAYDQKFFKDYVGHIVDLALNEECSAVEIYMDRANRGLTGRQISLQGVPQHLRSTQVTLLTKVSLEEDIEPQIEVAYNNYTEKVINK